LQKKNLYNIEHELLNLEDYGIPQKRRRLFIVGLSRKITSSFFPLSFKERKNLGDVLVDVPYSKGISYSLKKQTLFKRIPQGGC